MLERSYARVEDVPPDTWEDATPEDFFFRRDFLRVMEESSVEDARYRYLTFSEGGAPVGAAVLSAFTLKLDLLSGDPWVGRLRRFFPSVLDVRMICCGIPASFGQHHLHVNRLADAPEAFRRVDRFMEDWAREESCGLVLWKEWRPEAGLAATAREAGYLAFPTLPDHVIDPLPATQDGFVRSMRSAYRRKYRVALRLLEGDGPVWRDGGLRLEERPFAPGEVSAFYRGYQAVMERTPVRLETYPRMFFETLASSALDARILSLEDERDGTGLTALLVPGGRTLAFALVAKEAARYADGLYTTLLRCIVLYAIRGGYGILRLGQTSSYSKVSVGAEPKRLETFIRMRGPWKHTALRYLGPLLFPEAENPDLRVFHLRGGQPGSPTSTSSPREAR